MNAFGFVLDIVALGAFVFLFRRLRSYYIGSLKRNNSFNQKNKRLDIVTRALVFTLCVLYLVNIILCDIGKPLANFLLYREEDSSKEPMKSNYFQVISWSTLAMQIETTLTDLLMIYFIH